MIAMVLYFFILGFVAALYVGYKLGHQAGYNKARRDYRQGMRLVRGYHAAKR